MKKKLRNGPVPLVLVEPINGKVQNRKKSVKKQDSVETLTKKQVQNEPVLSEEVKKESPEDIVSFTEDGSSDLLSRSLNEAYKKMTGSSLSSAGSWKALEAQERKFQEEKHPNPDSVSTFDSA